MAERVYTSSAYRFGFGGQESDQEVYNSASAYTAEFWEYDARLGRRWNVDPVIKPWESSFTAFSNNPLVNNDPDGRDSNPIVIKIGRIGITIAKKEHKRGKYPNFPLHIRFWKTPKIDKAHRERDEKRKLKISWDSFEIRIPAIKGFRHTNYIRGRYDEAGGRINRRIDYPSLNIGSDLKSSVKGISLEDFVESNPEAKIRRLKIAGIANDAGGINTYNISIDGSPFFLNKRYTGKTSNFTLTSVLSSTLVQTANNSVFDACNGLKERVFVTYKILLEIPFPKLTLK